MDPYQKEHYRNSIPTNVIEVQVDRFIGDRNYRERITDDVDRKAGIPGISCLYKEVYSRGGMHGSNPYIIIRLPDEHSRPSNISKEDWYLNSSHSRRHDTNSYWFDEMTEDKPPQPKESSMNLSQAVFLVDPRVRAVIGVYEPEVIDVNGNVKNYNTTKGSSNRRMFKTYDTSLKVDDLVVVPSTTRHKATIVKLVEVDAEVDFDSSDNVDWVIGKVTLADYEDLKAQEAKAHEHIKKKQKLAKQKELLETMALTEEDVKAMALNPKMLTAIEHKAE